MYACDVKNTPTGFLGLSGEFIETNHLFVSFTELNSKNEHHGRGILMTPGDEIYFKHYENGVVAPGNTISIVGNGDFSVGRWYKTQTGQLKWNGILYRAKE